MQHVKDLKTNGSSTELGLGLARPFALLDELPEFSRLPELIVFRHRQFASEKKIPQRIFVQNAVHRYPFRTPFKVDTIIFRAITMQFLSLALNDAEAAGVEIVEVFRQNLKFREQLELKGFRQRRHLCRAQLVEDDLEHPFLTDTHAARGCQYR